MKNIKKIYRYAVLYGPKRAFVKALGRSKRVFPLILLLAPFSRNHKKHIGMIGCGQFAFSTIAFFLTKNFGRCIFFCLDKNPDSSAFLAKCYGIRQHYMHLNQVLDLKSIKIVYIASNHASHADYALYFLKRGINVYIEKPISVSEEQLLALKKQVNHGAAHIFAGYNRPFSKAVVELIALIKTKPFTLNCVVCGHLIPPEHWYRQPEEGTRICGNLGHWLDLAVHLVHARGCSKYFYISVACADESQSDDNLTVVMKTENKDLITLTLTAREEPFEGINETIIFQQEELFVKIDDFRQAIFQQGSKKTIRKYKPKDVGHEHAILQPFSSQQRNIQEVFLSTALMLHVMNMVKIKQQNSVFRIK